MLYVLYGAIDTDSLWREVGFRAKNNYGQWTDEDGAKACIKYAIEDILHDVNESMLSDKQGFGQLLKEMMEK